MSTPVNHDASMAERKAQHLSICIEQEKYAVEGGSAGWDRYRFVHKALPELNFNDINTELDFLGYRVRLPFFISSMTGGSDEGFRLNKDLARLAQAKGVPVGMGSIRILFRRPEVFDHFTLKKLAPDVPVVANLGGVQIRDMVHSSIVDMIKRLEVDALAIHLNPAQEMFQVDGDVDFAGILDGIRRFCAVSPVPVIIKETGCGIGPHEAASLLQAGASYVNIAGSGGTNWATVESYRATALLASSARDFTDWGNPSALVLDTLRQMEASNRIPHGSMQARSVHQTKAVHAANKTMDRTSTGKGSAHPQYKGLLGGRILASGGIRNGMDLAVSLALGAYSGGTALPMIRAVAQGGFDEGLAWMETLEASLRRIMLLTASPSIAALRAQPLLVDPAWQNRVEQYIRICGGTM